MADKVALITGAAGGQGVAEAELFASEGAALMLTDVDAERGRALAERLAESGARAHFHEHDVSDEMQWQALVAATVAELGGLHILVNNAGTIARQSIPATKSASTAVISRPAPLTCATRPASVSNSGKID